MYSTATAAEVRQYLHDDNGWTHTELDALFAVIGTRTRTHAQWELDIARFMGEGPA